jgi:hypothetical protein
MAMNDNTNMNEEMRARYQELKDKEDSGMLDDAGRMELQDIKDRMEMNE